MIIKINSDNLNLSYVLRKNPDSPMNIYKYRCGYILAHYINPQEYVISFESAPNQFWDETCYLDSNPYTNPIAYLGCLREAINDVLIKDCDKDIPSNNVITLSYLKVLPYSVRLINNLLPDINIKIKDNLVILSSNSTLKELTIACFLLLVLNISSREGIYFLGDSFFNKIITILEKLNKPISYSVVHKLTTQLLPWDKFTNYKYRLENLLGVDNCDLDYRYLQQARKQTIKSIINRNNVCVDLGAGEGQYGFLSDENIVKDYIAIDRDEVCRDKLISKGYKVYSDINEVEIIEPTTTLLTEVIEHSELEESVTLLNYIKDISNVSQIIITVPNVEFNKYFDMEEGMYRHYDHKWEPTYLQFIALINTIFVGWNKQFLNIGTSINNVTPTIGVELTRND
jgi:hypothetical protein